MNTLKLIIISLIFIKVDALNYNQNLNVSNQLTSTYETKVKSTNPNQIVGFISDLSDPDYLFISESIFDNNDLSDNQIIFTRAVGLFIKPISSCTSESGTVAISTDKTKLTISGPNLKFPLRILCKGLSSTYNESYSTFRK